LEKNVSLSHIATTILLVTAGLWWFVENEGRIANIELAAQYTERRLTQVEETQITQAQWIAEKLEKIRKEQREDILRLQQSVSDGFVRIEEKIDGKADK
jgi:hypothetical protein